MTTIYAPDSRERRVAGILLTTESIMIRPDAPFTYASKKKGPIYCDNRRLLSFPEERIKIVQGYLDIIQEQKIEYDVLGGIATAGIAWAAILSHITGKPMIYIRAKAKEHGKENQVEGKLEMGQRVLLIEDHITTGGSSTSTIQPIQDLGGIVECCLAISSYENTLAAFHDANCQLYTQTVLQAILEEAIALQKITEEQKKVVLDWKADPAGWAARHGFE